MRRIPLILVLVASILFAVPWLTVAASPGPRVQLKYAAFDPLAREPIIPAALLGRKEEAAYYLVQFTGPIETAWRDDLVALGARIMDYVPDWAYLVAMDADLAGQAAKLGRVRWVGPYRPAYKLSQELRQPAEKSLDVLIQIFADRDVELAAKDLTALGAQVRSASAGDLAGYIRATLPTGALVQVDNLPAVSWIERYHPVEPANDVSREIMTITETWARTGLFGAGQIVAVADTGLDNGNPAALHRDFRGRLLKAYALGRPPDDWSDASGHGTHVAGSILGNGARSGSNPAAHDYAGSFAGVAPEASLIFQSLRDGEGNFSTGIPSNLNELFQPPYQDGARIHSNSWGGNTGGDDNPLGGYVSQARHVDEFTWTHKDMTILFSAGNQGVDADSDGVVDLDSLQYPGTAKNAITIGASESERSGGYARTWGETWPDDFKERPVSTDRISNDPRGIAAFSGRGPTDDGRIKPDLVAPGTNIVSVRSQDAEGTGWGAYDDYYLYMGGTSMATPLTSGAAALVRERYVRHQGVAKPSGALIKATLINGAESISPGQYPVGPCQEIPDQTPNMASGWGRVNLANAIAPLAPRWTLFRDSQPGLSTGQTVSYDISLQGSSRDLAAFAPLPGEPDAASEPAPQAGATCQQLLYDGGFEYQGYNWQTEGNIWLSEQAHSGAYSAWLGGQDNAHDWLWQSLYIPANATRVTLSFWYTQDSEENYCGYDDFWVGFYEPDWGDWFAELLWQDGKAVTEGWAYKQITLREAQLAAIRDQNVHLAFELTTDDYGPTSVRLDDVTLEICTAAPDATPTPLRVTLVWTDYPGALWAAKTLVNDLDLEVVAPDGRRYRGNGGTQPDRLNPVEDVIIPSPLAGRHQIVVRGYNVPSGPQPFAIVASGADSGTGLDHRGFLPLIRKTR